MHVDNAAELEIAEDAGDRLPAGSKALADFDVSEIDVNLRTAAGGLSFSRPFEQ